ncbi:Maf family protein [Erythrobacteraceae bacterium WH01K]|nr:Maf family protein [Erythrobacteraceae bacterium WH01K]
MPIAAAQDLILASKSASRRAMLDGAGIKYRSRPADIDERALERAMDGADPAEIVQALAAAKAAAVSAEEPSPWVLGSDSLVEVGGQRFDKPQTREQAADHLRFFSGKPMHLHSAAALARNGAIDWIVPSLATLHVRELSDHFIEGYLGAEWPEIGHCAGAFRLEAMGVHLFERIIGDHFTVLGMPLLPVLGALRERGMIAE